MAWVSFIHPPAPSTLPPSLPPARSARRSTTNITSRYELDQPLKLVYKYFDARFCSCASGSVPRLMFLYFFQSEFFRREITNRINPVSPEGISILKSIRKPENVVLRMPLKLGCKCYSRHRKTIDTRLIVLFPSLSRDVARRRSQSNFKNYDARCKICFAQGGFAIFDVKF